MAKYIVIQPRDARQVGIQAALNKMFTTPIDDSFTNLIKEIDKSCARYCSA